MRPRQACGACPDVRAAAPSWRVVRQGSRVQRDPPRGPFVPTILRIQGFRVYFWSREPNEPPHVHLDKGGASAKVWLEPVALASNVGFPAHELGVICGWFARSNLRY